MLQNFSEPQPAAFEHQDDDTFELSYVIGLIKRRIFYFVIPFTLVLVAAFAFIKLQKPLFRAEGEILVESPAIPPDLVHPTITESPEERFEVFKQRIFAGDNLLAVISKYNLFPDDRNSLPDYALLTLMRTRVEIKPVTLELQRPGGSIAAFRLAFSYEVPETALNVTKELINEILSQDTSRRTSAASEATRTLEQEVKRMTDQHDAVVGQLESLKQKAPDKEQEISETAKSEMKSLADLEAELIQKSSVYSDEHPAVKNLKKRIATLKQAIASAPTPGTAAGAGDTPDVAIQVLQQRRMDIERNLEDANRKLAAARLGETMERNRQAEHLQLIETPELPHKPVTAKMKLFLIALFAAGAIGAVSAFAAEKLDGSIRSSRDLAAIVDRHLIVTIPYMSTPADGYRKRRNLFFLFAFLAAVSLAAIAVLVVEGLPVELQRVVGLGSLFH
jgi:polysaccharide biosynthesis transport protein